MQRGRAYITKKELARQAQLPKLRNTLYNIRKKIFWSISNGQLLSETRFC